LSFCFQEELALLQKQLDEKTVQLSEMTAKLAALKAGSKDASTGGQTKKTLLAMAPLPISQLSIQLQPILAVALAQAEAALGPALASAQASVGSLLDKRASPAERAKAYKNARKALQPAALGKRMTKLQKQWATYFKAVRSGLIQRMRAWEPSKPYATVPVANALLSVPALMLILHFINVLMHLLGLLRWMLFGARKKKVKPVPKNVAEGSAALRTPPKDGKGQSPQQLGRTPSAVMAEARAAPMPSGATPRKPGKRG
jgi:hypothetical protein